jgi:uncharacterized protein
MSVHQLPRRRFSTPLRSRRAGVLRLDLMGWLLAVQAILIVALTCLDGQPQWLALRALVVVGATAPAVVIAQGRRTWLRICVIMAAGLAGCVLGGGIGVPYAMKDLPSWRAGVGLATLVCGLALVGGALVLIARTRSYWTRSLLLPVVVVVATTVWTLFPAVMATNVPPTALGRLTPASQGISYADVTARASDGVNLSGWYIASHNRAAVVMLHGSGSTRSATLSQATALANQGYGVLMIDARGHGRSGGRAMDFGWYGDRDVEAGVTFLTRQRDVDPLRIGVVGFSMGGEEALGAAAADPRIRAVVAEGATTRTAGDKAGWLPHGVAGSIQRVLDRAKYGLADLLTSGAPPMTLRRAATVAAPRPVLLITAGNVADETRAARYIATAGPSVRIWKVAGADHTGGFAAQPQAWVSTVTAFLDTALALPPA